MSSDSDKKVSFDPATTNKETEDTDRKDNEPRSVQEWLEQNDTRNNAAKQIQKIDSNIGNDCLEAYDCFLRTQVFQDLDSNLIKNLESQKRKEIERFKKNETMYSIEKMIRQTRTAFHDAKRQEKAMQKILKTYEERDKITLDQKSNIEHENVIQSVPDEVDVTDSTTSKLEVGAIEDELRELNLKPIKHDPLIIIKSERTNTDGAMRPVTEYAGSKGPKWVAMYQPPYKQLYRKEPKSQKNKTPAKPRSKLIVKADDLITNELDYGSSLSSRFHVKARTGSYLIK